MPGDGTGSGADSPPYELRVLGPFELVERASGRSAAVKSLKMRALLTFLSATPGARASRRQIADLFWGSRGEAPALHNLRVTLSSFRKTDPHADILTVDEDVLALNLSLVAADRSILDKARQSGELESLRTAASLYRGEFGHALELDEEGFDDWLKAERARTQETAIAALDTLVRKLAALGAHREALQNANRLLTVDPLREETHRLVIAEEDAVSGRASALARFHDFADILKAELGVAPERDTLELVEKIRTRAEPRVAAGVPELPPFIETETPPAAAVTVPAQPAQRHRPRLLAAATLAAVLLAGSITAWQILHAPATYAGETTGRISVAILPFQRATENEHATARIPELEADTRLAVSRAIRLAPVEIRDGDKSRDPVSAGHALGARYVVRTTVSSGSQADVALFDTTSGVSVAAATISIGDNAIKFARELFRFVYPEIILHRARTLARTDPDSTAALLWQAEAARIKTRVGAAAPDEASLFENVLSREPDQFFALLGLANTLILRTAREQSPDRAADIARATELLRRAREQAPSVAEIAFEEGMLNKLQGKFEAAGRDFERAVRLDRTHWNAAAQAAHVKIFMGRIEDGYREMEAATAYLLPDIAAAETAYIAGETALVAGHPERAAAYLDMALAGNATVARIHGMQAAALWMAGRYEEARIAARESRRLQPPYSPDLMAKRGRATASPRFKEARDRYVAAYRAALAPAPVSTN